jgi:hypothetical protein
MKWNEKRNKAQEENHKWINPEVIANLSDEDLEAKFLDDNVQDIVGTQV